MTIPANPIDLTTIARVKSWQGVTDPGAMKNFSDDDNIQACITAASNYWLWRTGKISGLDQVPSQSPFVQPVAYSDVYDGDGGDRQFVRVSPIQSVQSVKIFNVSIPLSANGISAGYVIDGSRKAIALVGVATGRGYPRNGAYGIYQNPFGGASPTFGGWRFTQGIQNVFVSYTAGFNTQSVAAELQTVPLQGSFQVIVNIVPWLTDSGVSYFSNGNPLLKVFIAPQVGQYFVLGGGAYLFNAADAGKQMLISYQASGVPPDVELAARQMVSVNIKRRRWIDQKSQSMANGGGTTSYRDWELPREVTSVMENYTRRAIVY